MAKGNLFQGMARGKVGDVVLSRLDGQQIARVRNRAPRNPRTNAQLYQRAIMATIMQAYAAGKMIFDHSFEGESVGAGCQRKFMSENVKHLRSIIADEVNNGTALADQVGHVVGPGVKAPVVNGYIVSKGSYIKNFICDKQIPTTLDNTEKVNAYCTRLGIVPGDIYTLVGFSGLQDGEILFSVNGVNSEAAKQRQTNFFFVRMQVKSNVLTTEDTMANLSQILEITDTYNAVSPSLAYTVPGDEIVPELFLPTGTYTSLYTGIIRSREDSALRSNAVISNDNSGYTPGILSQYALQAWKQGSQNIGDSDLILEGGDE